MVAVRSDRPSPPKPPKPSPVRGLPSVGGKTGELTPGTQFNSSAGGPRRPATGGGPAPAPAPPPGRERERERDIDWRDASYWAQLASIDRALRDFETGLATRTGRYGEDYMRGVRDLGYRPGEGFVAAPDILPFQSITEGMAAIRRPAVARAMGATAEGGGVAVPTSAAEALGGRWDYEGEFNPFSAATRGTRTARDEFAGRGMLRSSDFAQSYAEFQDRLNQQLEAMETGRGRFLEDAVTNLAQQRATAQERREAAARDAAMRAALMAGGR